MFMYILLYVFFICVTYVLYYYKKVHYRFELAGLKYLPGLPLFGNVWKSTFLLRHFIYDLGEVYNAFPDEKYVGFVEGMTPVILVRDPELMKAIVIKDSSHFQNRKQFFPERLDPLLGRSLLELQDEEWKTMRVKLTPAFTAARLRHMLPAMIGVSKSTIKSLKNLTSQEVDLTDYMYKYSGDVVTAAAFGFRDCTDRDDMLVKLYGPYMKLNFWKKALVFFSIQFPTVGEVLKIFTGVKLFPKQNHDFLRRAVTDSISYRREHNLSIPDYMDVLTKISNGIPIDDLAGQVFFSFSANFISGSSTLRFCLYELALNPEIQERLYQEIRNNEAEQITMESLNSLKYLEGVLYETSRKWSTALMMDRVCTKSYLLPPPREGGKPYLVNPGDMIFNVVNPVHMDPKFHSNPNMFNPERFSDKNKLEIKPFTFMPFGMGPRGCLGSRFATLALKVMIYHMVLNFKLVQCERTSTPIQVRPDESNLSPLGGTWVRVEQRE